ncbi:MAG: hypothetical protein LQ340_006388 [Diploschistes diacapsis]|nr:MAG: hypothetical protein LQ340_006388 [Diploschistes diacapsis]
MADGGLTKRTLPLPSSLLNPSLPSSVTNPLLSSASGPTSFIFTTNPDTSIAVATSTPTGSTFATAASQQSSVSTPSATGSTSTNTNKGSSGGLSTGQELAAIITPIAFIIILIPILYMLWVRHRTRTQRRRSLESRREKPRSENSETPAQETRLLRHSPQNSAFSPSPLNNGDRIKSGSLGVFELRRSLEDHGRAGSIGVFHPQRRNTGHTSSPIERGPSPTLPSPRVPEFNRPPSEAWPLPAGGIKLPSPTTVYDSQTSKHKPLPAPGPAVTPLTTPSPSSPSPHELPPIINSRDHNPDILSYASSDVLVAPDATWRPTSSTYDLTPSTGTFPENARPLPQQSQRAEQSGSNRRHRDSDLVSELSYRDAGDRDTRRDTDAVSVVSALTDKRRRSERDADALSLISALSPEEPRVHMEHYPL